MHKKHKDPGAEPGLADLDQIEIQPLSNEDLESAFGGYDREVISCSTEFCSGGC